MSNIDWSTFTFRCSSLGYIMVPAKGKSNLQKYEESLEKLSDVEEKIKSTKNKDTKIYYNLLEKQIKLNSDLDYYEPIRNIPHLSETCKTHLCDIYTSNKYDITEDIKNKYIEKGLRREEDAITLYTLVCGVMYSKNKIRKFNEWINGECDIDKKGEIFVGDTKSNWSVFQFTRTVAKPINFKYKWQLKGYCWLFGKRLGKLIYCLLDTPEHLIVAEERRLLYDFLGSEEEYKEACKELRRCHIYDYIPNEEKIREYEVYFSEEDITAIKKKIEDCRWYIINVISKKKDDGATDSDEVHEE